MTTSHRGTVVVRQPRIASAEAEQGNPGGDNL